MGSGEEAGSDKVDSVSLVTPTFSWGFVADPTCWEFFSYRQTLLYVEKNIHSACGLFFFCYIGVDGGAY